MENGKGHQHRCKKAVNYEEAMNQALSEIFRNLKEIHEDTRKQREKVSLRRRRVSAPATALRETTVTLKQPKKELLDRKLSTPVPVASSTLSTMHWVLQCFEEEEEETGVIDSGFGFLNNY